MSGRSRRSGRGVPGEDDPPTSVGEALAEIGAELGLADPAALGAIERSWPDVVGAPLARNARVRSLRGTTLTVGVSSGAWATELRYLEHDVLARLESVVGAGVVAEVRIVVDATSGRGERA